MWLAHGLLALSAAFAPAAQYGVPDDVEPRTWRSASGEFELFVDPSTRTGAGSATYRMSRAGTLLWTVIPPFTLTELAVANDGTVIGCGYTYGEFRRSGELGEVVVALLAPDGQIRKRHDFARARSNFLHTAPDPKVAGLLLLESADRCFVRVHDADVNRASEAWWAFRLSSGDKLAELHPRDSQTGLRGRAFIEGARAVRGLPLVIVQWFLASDDGPGYGARFALLDEQARSVWTLDLPADYMRDTDDATSWALQLMRKREQAAVLSADLPARFDLWHAKEAQRVTYEVRGGPASGWTVTEVARVPFDGVTPAPAPQPAATQSSTVPQAETPALRALGALDLEPNAAPRPAVHDVGEFAFDGAGNLAYLRLRYREASKLVYVDEKGALIAEHALPFDDSEHGSILDDITWVADDRFAVGWQAHNGSRRPHARLYFVSARSGDVEKLAADIGEEVTALASLKDGGLVVLGDNRIDAFDRRGERLWTRASEDGLCGAESIAVLGDGRIVALDHHGLQWISASGKIGRYRKLADLWKRAPSYVGGIEADIDGGLVAEHDDRLVLMDAEGKQTGELAPRFADGRAVKIRSDVRAGAAGKRWLSDGHVIVALDANGEVSELLGESIEAGRLGRASGLSVDADDRLSATSSETGVRFEGDVEHGLAAVAIGAGAGSSAAKTAKYGDAQFFAQPGGEREWRITGDDLALVDAEKRVVRKIERRPDGRWIAVGRTILAPDGSLAVCSDDIVVLAPDGNALQQIATGAGVSIAYDGARVAVFGGGNVTIHDLRKRTARTWRVPGLDADTSYWKVFLPRKHDELWVFDNDHTLHRFALARE